jgi:hypothetical protein
MGAAFRAAGAENACDPTQTRGIDHITRGSIAFAPAATRTNGRGAIISLGRYFSDRVMALDRVMGNVTWAAAALLVAIFPGYRLVRISCTVSSRGA